MAQHPEGIKFLIDQFAKLPGIGPKTAERLVFYLLKQSQTELETFSEALVKVKATVTLCQTCQNFSATSPCDICADPRRSRQVVCVVAKPQDVFSLEKTGEYQGTYHVLGGLLDPLAGVEPERLTIKQLAGRIKNDGVIEVILAFNSDMPGESTVLYLTKLLKQLSRLKITRLAQGLPIGSDLEYADEITLTSALKGRREL